MKRFFSEFQRIQAERSFVKLTATPQLQTCNPVIHFDTSEYRKGILISTLADKNALHILGYNSSLFHVKGYIEIQLIIQSGRKSFNIDAPDDQSIPLQCCAHQRGYRDNTKMARLVLLQQHWFYACKQAYLRLLARHLLRPELKREPVSFRRL